MVTWRRPSYVDACLSALDRLPSPPLEVVVVDASDDDETARVTATHTGARHVRFPGGAGHMTTARNEGLRHVSGEIVAFLDDDANVRPGWLPALTAAYASDPAIGAVAGRTCNGVPGEERAGIDAIGVLTPGGELTGNFAADPGRLVDVDHGIGANMSFRRGVLAELGGFRDDFPGTALREDSDMFLRVRALGYRAVFAPEAVADHVGAPHVKGRRFDFRYQFWARHNHALLLARTVGLGSPVLWRWLTRQAAQPPAGPPAGFARRLWRRGVNWGGLLAGLGTSARKAGVGPASPRRTDAVGLELRRRLSAVTTMEQAS